ncbi:hypothetical protein WJX81_007585 [Elliptochloris bilobata]|uniref:chloroplast protein-transporting ATPase n=1 Tax=Elliptochloris bilobata TaxID=381761 RepID=A0AAW1S8K6_9CHLO
MPAQHQSAANAADRAELKERGPVPWLPKPWREGLVTAESRTLERYGRSVQKVNAMEPEMRALSDDELRNRTTELRRFLEAGTPLDDLLVEAFAVAREAARRVLGLRPYDVQLVGGMALHEGRVAEMRTGEGKTLAAVMPAYLNALSGRGVHLITVNEYLAARDREWMGKVFEFLGLTVAVARDDDSTQQKRAAFGADVMYITARLVGFTHLRDNSASNEEDVVMLRPWHYAIVDEVDSLLIDECRNPMIISVSDSAYADTKRYELAAQVVDADAERPLYEAKLYPNGRVGHGHFTLERKHKRIGLTQQGMRLVLRKLQERGVQFPGAKAEKREPGVWDLWEGDGRQACWGVLVVNALRAREMHQRDVQYLVRDGEVKIIDEATGREQALSRWTDGLHQAIEAKEGLEVRGSASVVGSITFQMLFKYYPKLGGMTGTAATESEELYERYRLRVLTVPTHRPCIRVDHDTRVYYRRRGKQAMLYSLIDESAWRRQPVLIGTSSVADSDEISAWLTSWSIPHQMLNARPDLVAREAAVIAQAGLPGRVTIATSMAGRGTDIILGGNPKGLATSALEDLALPLLSQDGEGWESQTVPMPEFRNEDAMRDYLPPQLLAALALAKAVLRAGSVERLPVAAARRAVAAAINRAEVLRSQFSAEAPPQPPPDAWPAAPGGQLDALGCFCEAHGLGTAEVHAAAGRRDSEGAAPALARAALHLWVWFDARCARLAAQVRDAGGLRVILASLQATLRGENQLRGRAGRQGDPGETLSLLDVNDRLIDETGSMKLIEQYLLPMVERSGMRASEMHLEGFLARSFVRAIQGAYEEGGRVLREQLALYDEVLDVYRQHHYDLRRRLVANSRAGRVRILHAYMLECAMELVQQRADLSVAPWEGDAWRLQELVATVRRMVNPFPQSKVAWHFERPWTDQAKALFRKTSGLDVATIEIDPVPVLGLADDVAVADDLRRRLQAREPLPRAESLHSTEASLAEIRDDLVRLWDVHEEDFPAERRSETTQYGAEARALAGMVAEALVVAYEHGKRPAIAIAMNSWSAALGRPSRREGADGAAAVAAKVEEFERDALVEALDAQWIDFLATVKNLETGSRLRIYSAQDPLEEYRLESGAMFAQLLEQFRREAVAEHAVASHALAHQTPAQQGTAHAFQELLGNCGASGCVQLEFVSEGFGLIATQPVAEGEVVLRVPVAVCLIVDYANGASLPSAAWPRLRQGLSKADPLTWDLLLSLALMDAVAGDGGSFWEAYASEMLPEPQALAVPFCLPHELLLALRSPVIASGAQEQQARLRALFPGLAQEAADGVPGWLHWAFACVRSRAFCLGPERFAFVPFLDAANHAVEPRAAYREAGGAVELVALEGGLAAGQQVTISYSGGRGYTNQRFMMQYGFVLEGNMADRLALQLPAAPGRATGLSLERMQRLLGDRVFLDAVSGPPRHRAAMHKYRLLSKKGEGTFSEVLKAQCLRSAKYVAIKVMKNHFDSLEQVDNLREVQALRRLSHPNIITLLEVLFDAASGKLALVFELMEQNLYELIQGRAGGMSEEALKRLMFQLLQALAHMHRNGIFHRDVKPENILVTRDSLRLADFGSCRGMHAKAPFTEYISTRWYRAPECLLTDGYYTQKMDMWGAACVFFEVLTLCPLFPGTNELDQVGRITAVLGVPPAALLAAFARRSQHAAGLQLAPAHVSGLAALVPRLGPVGLDLLTRLLAYDPAERLSAEQALRHPYFRVLREEAAAQRAATAAPAAALRPAGLPAAAPPHSGRRSAAPPPLEACATPAAATDCSTSMPANEAWQPDGGAPAAPRVHRQRRKPSLNAGRASMRIMAPANGGAADARAPKQLAGPGLPPALAAAAERRARLLQRAPPNAPQAPALRGRAAAGGRAAWARKALKGSLAKRGSFDR